MTNNIYPPDHLLRKWESLIIDEEQNVDVVLYEAFQAGADQELEACCEWLDQNTGRWDLLAELRAARRPKPQGQAEEALIALEQTVTLLMPITGRKKIERFDIIRAALKRLRELEKTLPD